MKNKGAHRKKLQHNRQSEERFINIPMSTVQSPFQGVDRSVIEEIIRQIKADNMDVFARSLITLTELTSSIDLFPVICSFSFYDLLMRNRSQVPLSSEHDPLGQPDIEFLQALFLTLPSVDLPKSLPHPEDMPRIHDAVKDLGRSFTLKRFASHQERDEGFYNSLNLELMRSHTQGIRHWGTRKQVTTILRGVLAPLDAGFEKVYGISATGLVQFMENLGDKVGDRLTSHVKRFGPVINQRTPAEIIGAYQHLLGIEGTNDDILTFLHERNATVAQVRSVLLMHYDLFFLQDEFTFSLEEMQRLFPGSTPCETIDRILRAWSLAPGELTQRNPEHFILDNPVWTRPFIRLSDENYAFPIPPLLQAFGLEMIEALIDEHEILKTAYHAARAKYLQAAVAGLFSTKIRGARVYQNTPYLDPDTGRLCENDLLVLVDSYAIAVECKSARVTAKAKRGNPERFQRDVGVLVEEPANQALRFVNYLRQHQLRDCIPVHDGEPIPWKASPRRILPMTVTFDVLWALSASKRNLVGAGLIGQETASVINIALSDLECIFNCLPRTATLLHYLERRAILEARLDLLADEIDWLTFYLDNGFNIGEAEFKHGGLLAIYGASDALNPFLNAEKQDSKVARPVPKLSKWWKQIIMQLESRAVPGWTIMSNILLNVSYGDQKRYEQDFLVIMDNVRESWAKPGTQNCLFIANGPPQRRDVIVFLAVKRVTREKRNAMVDEACRGAFQHSPNNLVLVIVRDVEDRQGAYSMMCVMQAATTGGRERTDA
jgi:hypothetical protein